jgi:hypothetical protein
MSAKPEDVRKGILFDAELASTEHDYVVADLSQAAFGRKEIAIAETEMPGLVQMRTELRPTSRWPAHALPVRCT